MIVVLDLLAVTVCHHSAATDGRGERRPARLLCCLLRFLLHPCRSRLVTAVFEVDRRRGGCTTRAAHTAVI